MSSSAQAKGSAAHLDKLLTSHDYPQDPYRVYRALREHAPTHWCEPWQVWVVTRYEDIVEALRNPATFSNAGRFERFVNQIEPEERGALEPIVRHNASGMLQSDPPTHTRLRRIVQRRFVPRSVAAWEPTVVGVVNDLIQRLREMPSFDVIADIAFPLPFTIIGRLLGVPGSDTDLLAEWAGSISTFQATGKADARIGRGSARSIVEIEDYFQQLCQQRRVEPTDDLISLLVSAEDGDELTRDECIGVCVNLVLAGHETTRALIGSAINTIWREPSHVQTLRSQPEATAQYVEECLRFESPIQRGWRRVTAPVQVNDCVFNEGDLVYLMLGSANRDERRFDMPDAYEPGRESGAHIAFGLGPHFCLGAPLARLETTVLLRELALQMPGLSLGEPSRWASSIHVRTLTHLWATS